MTGWGGAQWVLLTWWAVTVLIRVGLRVAHPHLIERTDRQQGTTWGNRLAVRLMGIAALAAILWWGGFWR